MKLIQFINSFFKKDIIIDYRLKNIINKNKSLELSNLNQIIPLIYRKTNDYNSSLSHRYINGNLVKINRLSGFVQLETFIDKLSQTDIHSTKFYKLELIGLEHNGYFNIKNENHNNIIIPISGDLIHKEYDIKLDLLVSISNVINSKSELLDKLRQHCIKNIGKRYAFFLLIKKNE